MGWVLCFLNRLFRQTIPSYIVPIKTGLPVDTARSIISAARVTPPARLIAFCNLKAFKGDAMTPPF